jgi:hypothetical protein
LTLLEFSKLEGRFYLYWKKLRGKIVFTLKKIIVDNGLLI